MKTLKDYIFEEKVEELPEPLWDNAELEKFDSKIDVNRDKFSKKSVYEISGSELSGKNSDTTFKIGDVIYKDLLTSKYQVSGKDIYGQPYQISNIRKADKADTEWTSGKTGKYLITAFDAAGKFAIDVAQNFRNTDRD